MQLDFLRLGPTRFFLTRLGLTLALLAACVVPARAEFKAGAAVIDITPPKLPVLANGGMLSRSVDKIKTRIHARAIALADGKTQIAVVVVDSCMMSRPLLDEAKSLAEKRTGIPANRMLISATHAHSVPSSMGCLGTEPDPAYVPFLRDKLVEAVAAAQAALEPARVGFAKASAADFTALRQWIKRPDRVTEDPFGNMTVRANMHAGAKWDDATGEAGPEDPDLSLISIQSRNGRPLAVLGNFSMHYFGDRDLSADYYGLFCEGLKQRIAPDTAPGKPAFVGLMSHGCSGDIWRRDYTRPASEWNAKLTIDDYAGGLLDIAMKAYQDIRYRDNVDLAMAKPKITEAAIGMLEKISGQPRREWKLNDGPAARAILEASPAAYWRLNEFTGPHAADASGHGHDAVYEPEITYYLEGPRSASFCAPGELNRAAHFVGGRLRARLSGLGDHYSVSLWLWNGMPNDGRETSGWLFSRGRDHGLDTQGDHLGIGGRSAHTGRLIFFHGDDANTATAGKTEIPRWQWRHVVLVRDGQTVRIYLNGRLEIEAKTAASSPAGLEQCFFGGRSDGDSNWEGRLDEIAVFNRALTAAEVARLVVR